MAEIIILGGGGHAAVVAETAVLAGYSILGHCGPAPSHRQVLGPYLGQDHDILDDLTRWPRAQVVLGLGFVDHASCELFIEVTQKLRRSNRRLATVVHPSATVFSSATLEDGVFVAAQAVVGSGAHVETCTIINTGAIVDHDCAIGAGCHLAIGARLCGNIDVGPLALIGAGAIVRQGLSIGRRAVIGAGSVVVTSVAEGETAFGVAASARPDRRGHSHG